VEARPGAPGERLGEPQQPALVGARRGRVVVLLRGAVLAEERELPEDVAEEHRRAGVRVEERAERRELEAVAAGREVVSRVPGELRAPLAEKVPGAPAKHPRREGIEVDRDDAREAAQEREVEAVAAARSDEEDRVFGGRPRREEAGDLAHARGPEGAAAREGLQVVGEAAGGVVPARGHWWDAVVVEE